MKTVLLYVLISMTPEGKIQKEPVITTFYGTGHYERCTEAREALYKEFIKVRQSGIIGGCKRG